ncbi:hypothetical protein JANAI62_26080 [Jannaschia pagri]|uniref:Divergent polysaccharide deacetylase n=1 Tax=Jannaschia pagri TaxID=2829797 RepID=A0ABQ4NNY0_9RHOB|nr:MULTISPECIES: polysaccharide deacteylase family 2 protein [unclassified Jannaschia]GIT92150.1 hypothetical protein JANAI61_26080 [Jannaschia sp. AI_61]GIT95985.1 hypothetical protein JANAI62_26080 [Jannaschia sp. AI_62]
MWRGLLVGAGSGLGLSVLLIAGVLLLAPAPQDPGVVAQPGVAPQAPVVDTTTSDAVPTVPAPLPERSGATPPAREVAAADGVDLPAASEFNRPPVDLDPVVPGADPDLTRVAEGGSAPLGQGALAPAPSPDTTTAAQPQASFSIATVTAPSVGEQPVVPAEVIEGAPQTFREAPVTEDEVLAADVAGQAAPEPAAPTDGPANETLAIAPVTPPPDRAEVVSADSADLVDAEDRAGPNATSAVAATAPEVVAEAQITPRLIVLDSEREAAAEAASAEAQPRGPALVVNGEPFENPEGKPLFSIVLIDDPDTGVSRENLLGFSFPVAFAVDPTAPDAAEAVATYRTAGHEVLLMADALTLGGTAQTAEVSLAGALAAMPEGVAILDRSRGGLAANRSALNALLPPMAEAGLGLVTYGGGLNAGVATARRGGVPAQSIYRVLDDDNQRATVITRLLDRATFAAAQDGSAIVIGRTAPDTVTALFSWALGSRSQTVAVAPISHTLQLP